MAPEKNTSAQAPAKAPVVVDASAFTAKAGTVKELDKWVGTCPSDLKPGLASTDLEKVALNDLVNKRIVAIGYQERTGVQKGKDTNYLLILAVPEGTKQPVIISTGASVVCKKIRKAQEAGVWPLGGMVKLCGEGRNQYFDLVD